MASFRELNLLFEDEHLLLVDKPAGMLSIGDRFNPDKPNLRAILRNHYGDIFVVHRLDLDTSGVMVYAKNEEIHRLLSLQFAQNEVEKLYHAVCMSPIDNEGIINASIMESNRVRGTYMVHKDGKEAETHYKVLERWSQFALVECKLITGRTHQIRVHMKHIGAPLLVDNKYGRADAFYLSEIIRKYYHGKYEEERPLVSRTSLHSNSLKFTHPVTSELLKVEAPYPKDFRALIHQFTKLFGGGEG